MDKKISILFINILIAQAGLLYSYQIGYNKKINKPQENVKKKKNSMLMRAKNSFVVQRCPLHICRIKTYYF